MKVQQLHGTHSKNTTSTLKSACTAFFLFAATAALICGTPSPRAEAAPPALHVSGNQLVDNNNNPVYLKGANVTGLESSFTPDIQGEITALLAPPWNARIIRLPISQDKWEANRWYGDDGTTQQNYRQFVYNIVNQISNANAYVIVDLHWSDLNVWGQNQAQHNMADSNTLTTWQDLSTDPNLAYNPAVFFGLYNEPHDLASDGDGATSFGIWLNGGNVTEQYNGGPVTFYTPGIQALINAVRAQNGSDARNSDNVMFIGGLNYGYDLQGVANGEAVPNDPGGRGIVYDAHIYPFTNNEQKPYTVDPSVWDQYVTVEAPYAPIFIGEYGTGPYGESQDGANFVGGVQYWAGTTNGPSNGFCGSTAWAFSPYTTQDGALITDTTSFNPTQYEGNTVEYYINN